MIAGAAAGCQEGTTDVDGAGGQGGAPGTEPLYVLATTVFDADGGRQVYFGFDNSLDDFDFSLKRAREFAGVANFETIAGDLYISDGEEPIIRRYEITDDFKWKEKAAMSFAAFPLSDNANFFSQYMASDHAMYLPYDFSKRIVWDPLRMEILETLEDSALALEVDGLTLEAGGNRTSVRYNGPVMQPFFYHDEDWLEFGTFSPIAVYDPVTHEEISIIKGPCPGLAVPSIDEEGNTYFSSWDHTPYFALFDAGPAPCVARITKDRQLDEDFTTDMTEFTGGRYVMNFRYVRDGWGFADVLHHEELDADFSGDPDIDVLDQIFEFTHFHLWRIDLKNGTAARYKDAATGSFGWSTTRVDDRTFLFVPQDGGARTKIYELDDEGSATLLHQVPGDATWQRVR